jgi:hypothetical protein
MPKTIKNEILLMNLERRRENKKAHDSIVVLAAWFNISRPAPTLV